MQRWQCPIYNGTLKTLSDQVWQGCFHVFSILGSAYFKEWFLYQSVSHILTIGKQNEELYDLELEIRQYIYHSIDQIKVLL